MPKGTVKWFNTQKGFGFIGQENGPDLFVHHKAILNKDQRSLSEGDVVEFDITAGPKGDSATNVRVIERRQGTEGSAAQSQSLEEKLKALRKTSKERQSDISNRLQRRRS